MSFSHHYALLIGYATALAGWLVVARLLPKLWPAPEPARFEHPWREIGWALLAVCSVLGIGQLFQHGYLLPHRGTYWYLFAAVNQFLIFTPMLLLLLIRRQSLRTAWLPLSYVWARVLIGMALAAGAVAMFTLVRAGSDNFLQVYFRLWQPENIRHLVQILGEDIAIAVLLVRFRAAIGLLWSVILVAVLFAAAHIPALLANGATPLELANLLLDAGLGVLVLLVVQRSGDMWWFWQVHFAMDLMQWHAVPR